MAGCDTQNASLVIRLFGPFDVQVNGKPIPHPRTRKGQWLLALLILRQGGPVDRSWLAGQLWPESSESQALANLRQSLSDLRRTLGCEAVRLTAPTSQELAFDLTSALADVCLFDQYAVSKEAARLEEAIPLYRGPLLEGCPEEWVLQEREVREQAYLAALERAATLAHSQNDTSQAVSYLRRAALVDPWCESVQRKLMEALAGSGDLSAALQIYRDLRMRLYRELNAEPDAETTALFNRLRQAARQRAGLPPSQPQTAPVDSLRRLPRALSELIGREEETEEVLLRLTSSRLVTLVGSGGVGKTRLAVEVAEAVAPQMPDGVFFVDFAPLVAGSLVSMAVATAVAQALELKEAPGQSLLDLLRSHLHAKQLLLLLDNCEHLLQESATLATALLQSCPHVHIFATSRQALGITGEVSYRVPSLPIPPASLSQEGEKDRLSQLLAYASVRLFVERARASASDFELSEQNLMAIVRICRRLDGIPLALEMAAARVKALSVSQIAEKLAASFALLTGGSRTALPRQQTLQATLDWSWGLLSTSEQTMLCRLSVFAGGWTLEAAEQVCAIHPSLFPDEVLDLLTSLVDKSLVNAQEQHGLARYRMLETVRQYGRDRLMESGESDVVREQHRDYFLALAEEAEPKLSGAEQAEWLERLDAEHDNLRASLDWSLSEVGSRGALRLCGVLWRFWWARGHLLEGREWCERVLAKADGQPQPADRAKVLNGAGVLAYFQGDYASARANYEASLDIRRVIGDRSGIGASLNNLGGVAYSQGDYVSARAYHEESLDIKKEIGDRRGIADSLNNLGSVAYSQGDYASAWANLGESLDIKKEVGDRGGIASALIGLGYVASDRGDYASARAYFEEGWDIKKEIGDRGGIAYSLIGLGNVAASQGDYASARAYFEEGRDIKKEIGDRSGMARALIGLACVAADQGDYASARANLAECLGVRREIGDRCGIADSLEAFAKLATKESKLEQATVLWGATEALREEIGSLMKPKEQKEYDLIVAEVRQSLGEEAFTTAWEQGRGMPLEQAMDLATQEDIVS